MNIRCVWEHNGSDSILFAADFPGAYTRGETGAAALQKMAGEIASYQKWKGEAAPDSPEPVVVQEKASALAVWTRIQMSCSSRKRSLCAEGNMKA